MSAVTLWAGARPLSSDTLPSTGLMPSGRGMRISAAATSAASVLSATVIVASPSGAPSPPVTVTTLAAWRAARPVHSDNTVISNR